MMSRVIALIVLSSSLAIAQTSAPVKIISGATGSTFELDAMLTELARADVVFVGEEHDSANTHRLELTILQGIADRRKDAIVALEMFERDVQEPLDHFSMGHTSEEDFLAASRPWPNYATDYKPLVDFAISKNWPVIASNVPRRFASEIAKSGIDVLKTKSPEEQKLFAQDLQCPTDDEYFTLFAEAMGSHPAAPGSDAASVAASQASLERTYFAQCLKDETMGESVAQAYTTGAIGGASPIVVHFNGAFHSDFKLGTAARAARRLPGKRIIVVTVLPVGNVEAAAPNAKERTRGDYLIYTLSK
jgi:uncharacterized iron-regulated protein